VRLIGPFLASFSLCLLAMVALRPVAIALKWIDRPGGRKSHVGDVPVVGGLAMFLGMVLGLGLLPLPDATTGSLLAACTILVTVGLIDDRFTLSPWTRLPVQIGAAFVVMIGTGTIVETLGSPFFTGEVELQGITSYAFTILITIAAINAFNMLDGIDGLAGALALVAVVALAFVAHDAGMAVARSASVVFAAVIGAFLVANLPLGLNRNLRCFMGDSGSTLLGFCVAWLCIGTSQGPVSAVQPVTIGWIVAIPLFDLWWTVVRRTVRGMSLFKPDTGHLHHLVMRAGFAERGAFALLVGLSILLAVVGIALDRLGVPDTTSFVSLVVTGVVVVRCLYATRFLSRVRGLLVRVPAVAPARVAVPGPERPVPVGVGRTREKRRRKR
jgi:UDP-GlcNAc:undecaprenyl-phosphate GlcNAc-1-phosphate transferase